MPASASSSSSTLESNDDIGLENWLRRLKLDGVLDDHDGDDDNDDTWAFLVFILGNNECKSLDLEYFLLLGFLLELE